MARQQCHPSSQPQASRIHRRGSHIAIDRASAIWPWWPSRRWEVSLSGWGCVGRFCHVASHLVPLERVIDKCASRHCRISPQWPYGHNP